MSVGKNQSRLLKKSLCCQLLLVLMIVSCRNSISDNANSINQTDSLKTSSGRDSARIEWQKELDQFAKKTSGDSIYTSVPELIQSIFYNALHTLSLDSIPDTAFLDVINRNGLVRIVSNNESQELDSNLYQWRQHLTVFEDSVRSLGIEVLGVKERYVQFRSIGNNNVIVDRDSVSKILLKQGYIAFNITREPRLIKNVPAPDYEKLQEYILEDAVPAILLRDSILWNLPSRMAQRDSITNGELWQFLIDYREATDMLGGENLWNDPEYILYARGAYVDKNEGHPLRIILKREAEKLGFLLKSDMGDSFFGQSSDFIKNNLYEKTSVEMKGFLDLFLLAYENDYWNEGLLVYPGEIARRLKIWIDFGLNYPEFVAANYVKDEIQNLESILIQDDYPEPHFDENDLLLIEFKEALEYVFYNSGASKDIKEYYELLLSQDFRKTDLVLEYLDKYKVKVNKAFESSPIPPRVRD